MVLQFLLKPGILKIDFIHWTNLLKDAWNAEKWIDRFYLFLIKWVGDLWDMMKNFQLKR